MVNFTCLSICFAMVVGLVSSRPRYILIPLADVEVMRGGWVEGGGRRIARQTWAEEGDQAPEQDGRVERQAHGHHEHVDYGAHTGHHGAFGWYADFPVKTDH